MPQQCPKCAKENPDGFKFCGFCGAEIATVRKPQTERREVTVLFADMKGFTAMSETMDPDEVSEIMNDCFAGLGRCVKVEEGQVNKYSGDCIMAQFGAPVAHEDDPVRACRAALAMQHFLRKYAERMRKQHGVEIKLRIGVHCGLVAAGGIGAEDVHQAYDILGDTVNLAQRLEASADPGSVLVSEQVMHRTEGLFEFDETRSLAVKGKKEPVTAAPLVRIISDVDPRGRDGLSVGMVGRTAEMARLIELWNDTSEESYRISIRGDLGLGKTRLVEEVLPRIKDIEHVRVTATAITQRQPFGLAKRLLRAAAAFVTGNRDGAKSHEEFHEILNGIDRKLAVYSGALWYLAAPDELNVQPPEPDSETLRSLVEHGLVQFAEALAARWPDLCVILESYELSDQESRLLVEGMAAPRQRRFIQFVITARPESVKSGGAVSVVDIPPLNADESSDLLNALLRGAELPASVRATILERAGGVPLYLEEMVRSLRETRNLNEKDDASWSYSGSEDAEELDLPPSLRAAMLARIDRLPEDAREVLRIAAVQGMEIDLDIAGRLLTGHGGGGGDAARIMANLQKEGLFRPGDDAARVVFTSRLLRDTCYDTLTRKDRECLHKETAEALIVRAGSEQQVDAIQLASHYDEAVCPAEAARAYLRAGHRAADLFLNEEAETLFNRVLELTDALKDDPDSMSVRINAILRLSRVLVTTGEYDSGRSLAKSILTMTAPPESVAEARRLIAQAELHTGNVQNAEEELNEALTVAEQADDTRDVTINILLALAEVFMRSRRMDESIATVRKARETCCRRSDCLNRIRCDMLEGKVLHTSGSFKEAREKYEAAHETAQESGTFSEQARSANSLGNVARDIGEYDEAVKHFETALNLWKRTGDAEGRAGIYNNLGNIAMSRGEFAKAREQQEKALELFERIGNVQGAAMALANLALLAIEENQPGHAESLAENALRKLGDAGQWMRDLIQLIVGDAQITAGQFDRARKTFSEIGERCDETTNPLAYAGALRGLGRIALKERQSEEGLRLLKQSVILYGNLERAHEMARAQMYKGEALIRLDRKEDGLKCLRKAEKTFTELRAQHDAAKVRHVIEDINPTL